MKKLVGISIQWLAVFFVGVLPAWSFETTSGDWRYTVRPEDTLSQLADRLLRRPSQWPAWAVYNDLNDADQIQAGQVLRVPLLWLKHEAAPAILLSVSGRVQAKSPGKPTHPAEVGERLGVGSRVWTEHNSSAQLQFADGSTAVVQPNSFLQLDTLSVFGGGCMTDTRLRLQKGALEVNANPYKQSHQRFRVTTPSAVAIVRGTRFWIQVGERTLEQTREGHVLMQSAGRVTHVEGGFGYVAEANKAPSPPVALEAGPRVEDLPKEWTSLPIVFDLSAQNTAANWVLQVAQTPEFNDIVAEVSSQTPLFDLVSLPNGAYVLRVTKAEPQQVPSLPTSHAFSVNVLRRLQGVPVPLSRRIFERGDLSVMLDAAPTDHAYLVQLSEDPQGRQVLWQTVTQMANVDLPARVTRTRVATQKDFYLLVWVFSKS